MPPEIDTAQTLDKADSLYLLGHTPQVMQGFYISRLQEHYCSRESIRNPVLRGSSDNDPSALVWRPEPPTGLVIASNLDWKPDKSNVRPAVIVKRNAWQPVTMGIGDKMQGWYEDDGADRYSHFVYGSHTLFCLANTGAIAESLGTETFLDFVDFGPVLRRKFGLHRLRLESVGPVAQVPEAGGAYAVPITIAYAFEYCWTTRPEGPILQRISIGTVLKNSHL